MSSNVNLFDWKCGQIFKFVGGYGIVLKDTETALLIYDIGRTEYKTKKGLVQIGIPITIADVPFSIQMALNTAAVMDNLVLSIVTRR